MHYGMVCLSGILLRSVGVNALVCFLWIIFFVLVF